MRRKLLILNLALVMALAYAGVRIRGEWLAARARQSRCPFSRPSLPVQAFMPVYQEC